MNLRFPRLQKFLTENSCYTSEKKSIELNFSRLNQINQKYILGLLVMCEELTGVKYSLLIFYHVCFFG